MKNLVALVCVILNFLFNTGCQKSGCTDINSIRYDEKAKSDDGSCIYGGFGGHNTIIITPYFGEHAVASKSNYLDSVYVKINATSAPSRPSNIGGGPELYDKIFT